MVIENVEFSEGLIFVKPFNPYFTLKITNFRMFKSQTAIVSVGFNIEIIGGSLFGFHDFVRGIGGGFTLV